MGMFAPSLHVLADGTLVCLHGSYAPGHPGLRVIFSTDGGETWIAPAKDHGFLIDDSYGYGKAMPLADGSFFISYLATGGHRTEDAKQNAVRCIRMRVRADHSGIDLLPAPNRATPITQPKYVAARAAEQLVVDGKLDDAAWKNVEWTGDFGDITGDASKAPTLRTRAKMSWDDNNFYIAAEMLDPNVWATMKDHDSMLFEQPAFEIFIDPDGDGKNYGEIQTNPLGTVMELLMSKPYRERGKSDLRWNADGMKVAVHVDGTANDASDTDRGWSVEVAIPWAAMKDLGVSGPPRAGDMWRVNLSRVHYESKEAKAKYWTWSPHREVNMHMPGRFGIVQWK
jgi:hypothetical protein